jgi:Ulp1 family protease
MFDLYSIQYHLSHPEIWRRVRDLEYWEKDICVIPIHRKHPVEHWVLCIVLVNSYDLLLFDSFTSMCGWKQDLKESPIHLCSQ